MTPRLKVEITCFVRDSAQRPNHLMFDDFASTVGFREVSKDLFKVGCSDSDLRESAMKKRFRRMLCFSLVFIAFL